MMETRGTMLRQAAMELIKTANVNSERSFQDLIDDLEDGCKSGLLPEETCSDLKGIIRGWWHNYRKEMIIRSLKPELQELIKAVRFTKVGAHSEDEEIFALYKLYGGPGNELFSINMAVELGYMKGVRDERKRRKARFILKRSEVEAYE